VSRAAEAAAAVAIAATFMALSARLQAPTGVTLWDARQYYGMADRLARGEPAFAEVPYVYRVGVPWIVSRLSPANPREGFAMVNLAAALATAALLDIWLQLWVGAARIRLALVTLFAAAWHGPVRYVFFNPGYVDPLFLACVVAALLVIGSLARRYSMSGLALFLVLIAAGTLVRETMALVAVAFMFADNPIRRTQAAGAPSHRLPLAVRLAPLMVSVAVIAWTHAIVHVDTAERSFGGAIMQYLHKSPAAYALAWFTAFGPVLAVVAFDWRGAWRDLSDHEWLAALLALCAAIAFIGGSDTERFVFWTMPVVYLLIGRVILRHPTVFRQTAIMVSLIALQAVSARVFWGIPDPALDGASLAGQSLGSRLYGVLDRLIVIDHFHWNLWSSFGSRPFQIARLLTYLLITGALAWTMRVCERERASA
jgi:hypothetical protein